jgi:hypothetical protein
LGFANLSWPVAIISSIFAGADGSIDRWLR